MIRDLIDEFEIKYGYEAAERAAIYEYDFEMTRSDAEKRVILEINEKKERKESENANIAI